MSQQNNQGYHPTPSSSSSQSTASTSSQQSDQQQQQPPAVDSKCMSMIKNCLGVLFPKLLEGLTHPDQRDQLPSRKKKDKKQYHRVNNPDEEDEDEDEDEESKGNQIRQNDNDGANGGDDQNQFFNEFQSWRSNQSNKTSNSTTEMQDLNNNNNSSKQQSANKKNTLLTLSENEIEKQKNMIQDNAADDLFKDFNQQQKQRKLPAPPQNNRLKNSPPPHGNKTKLSAESKAPQLTDLFSELETSLGSQQQQSHNNQNISDQLNINMGSDGLAQQLNDMNNNNNNNAQQNQDILEEKGWDDEININIE